MATQCRGTKTKRINRHKLVVIQAYIIIGTLVLIGFSSIAEAAHDFWVKRKCGKDYRIVVLKSVEVKRVIDYYESKNFI